MSASSSWPKTIPGLPPELEAKRQAWHHYWLTQYDERYSFVTKFNERFLESLQRRGSAETVLELGPGARSGTPGLLSPGDSYYCCDEDPIFCEQLRGGLPEGRVACGDIQKRLPYEDGFFDRVVALHVLEHLPNLPAALREILRILKPDGHLDIVIPCEGSPLYTLGRHFSSARVFKKKFGSGFWKIMKVEHVNTASEIVRELERVYSVERSQFFPVPAPVVGVRMNLLAAFRLRRL
ncbi:MAG: class I SAM-dependent methyltransferase [Polyangiaceae bacterium]